MFACTGADPELTDLQPSAGIIGGALPEAGLKTGGAALVVSLIRGGPVAAPAALAGASAGPSRDLDLSRIVVLGTDCPLCVCGADAELALADELLPLVILGFTHL